MASRQRRATMNISIPGSLRAWVDSQVEKGRYGTVSEFIRALLRDAMLRQEMLEESLLAALDEGPLVTMTDADWSRIRREARRQAASDRRRLDVVRRKSA